VFSLSTTLSSEVQEANSLGATDATPCAKEADSSPVQELNTPLPMLPDFGTTTLSSEVHFKKALSPMVAISSGSEREVRPVHCAKAYAERLSSPSFISSSSSP
jgi:hypothetical protein